MSEEKEKLEGICCSCQSRQPARRIPYAARYGFVMDEHEYGGVRCEGVGQEPQVVIKDGRQIQSDSMYDLIMDMGEL